MNIKTILSKVGWIYPWAKKHPMLGAITGILILIPGLALLAICHLELIGDLHQEAADNLGKFVPELLLAIVEKHHAFVLMGSVYTVAASMLAMFGAACGIFAPPKGLPDLRPSPPGTGTTNIISDSAVLLKLIEERVGLEQQLQISSTEVAELRVALVAIGDRKEQYKKHYFIQLCERRLMLRMVFLIPFMALVCLAGSWIYPQLPLGNWQGVAFLVSLGLDRDLMHACVTAMLILLVAIIAGELIPRSRKLNKVTPSQILFAIVFAVFAANLCYLLISLGYERYYLEGSSNDTSNVRGINELLNVTLYRLLTLPAVAALGAQSLWHGRKHAPEGNPTPEDS